MKTNKKRWKLWFTLSFCGLLITATLPQYSIKILDSNSNDNYYVNGGDGSQFSNKPKYDDLADGINNNFIESVGWNDVENKIIKAFYQKFVNGNLIGFYNDRRYDYDSDEEDDFVNSGYITTLTHFNSAKTDILNYQQNIKNVKNKLFSDYNAWVKYFTENVAEYTQSSNTLTLTSYSGGDLNNDEVIYQQNNGNFISLSKSSDYKSNLNILIDKINTWNSNMLMLGNCFKLTFEKISSSRINLKLNLNKNLVINYIKDKWGWVNLGDVKLLDGKDYPDYDIENVINYRAEISSDNDFQDIVFIKNLNLVFKPSSDYLKDKTVWNRLNFTFGYTINDDLTTLRKEIPFLVEKPLDATADKSVVNFGTYEVHSPLKVTFNSPDESEVLFVNNKRIQVLDKNFSELLVDNSKWSLKKTDDTKDLQDENSQFTNKYEIKIISKEKTYIITFVVDTFNNEADFKWYAWNPSNNFNQKQLISPYLINKDGTLIKDKNGEKIINKNYDKDIDKTTGTKKELVWINFNSLKGLPTGTKTFIDNEKGTNDYGVLAEAVVIDHGALVTLNGKNDIFNYWQINYKNTNKNKSFLSDSKAFINPKTQKTTENSYFSSSGLWLFANGYYDETNDKKAFCSYKLIYITNDKVNNGDEWLKNSHYLTDILSLKYITKFWLSKQGIDFKNYLVFIKNYKQEQIDKLDYEHTRQLFYDYLVWKKQRLRINDDSNVINNVVANKKVIDFDSEKLLIYNNINSEYLSKYLKDLVNTIDLKNRLKTIDWSKVWVFNNKNNITYDENNFNYSYSFNYDDRAITFTIRLKNETNSYFLSNEKAIYKISFINDTNKPKNNDNETIWFNWKNHYYNPFKNINIENLNLKGISDKDKIKQTIINYLKNILAKSNLAYQKDWDIANWDVFLNNISFIQYINSESDIKYQNLIIEAKGAWQTGQKIIGVANAIYNELQPLNLNNLKIDDYVIKNTQNNLIIKEIKDYINQSLIEQGLSVDKDVVISNEKDIINNLIIYKKTNINIVPNNSALSGEIDFNVSISPKSLIIDEKTNKSAVFDLKSLIIENMVLNDTDFSNVFKKVTDEVKYQMTKLNLDLKLWRDYEIIDWQIIEDNLIKTQSSYVIVKAINANKIVGQTRFLVLLNKKIVTQNNNFINNLPSDNSGNGENNKQNSGGINQNNNSNHTDEINNQNGGGTNKTNPSLNSDKKGDKTIENTNEKNGENSLNKQKVKPFDISSIYVASKTYKQQVGSVLRNEVLNDIVDVLRVKYNLKADVDFSFNEQQVNEAIKSLISLNKLNSAYITIYSNGKTTINKANVLVKNNLLNNQTNYVDDLNDVPFLHFNKTIIDLSTIKTKTLKLTDNTYNSIYYDIVFYIESKLFSYSLIDNIDYKISKKDLDNAINELTKTKGINKTTLVIQSIENRTIGQLIINIENNLTKDYVNNKDKNTYTTNGGIYNSYVKEQQRQVKQVLYIGIPLIIIFGLGLIVLAWWLYKKYYDKKIR